MSLRGRIFAVFVLAACLGMYGLVSWMQSELRPQYLEAQEEPLVDLTQLLAAHIETHSLVERGRRVTPAPELLRDSFEAAHMRRFQARIYSLTKRQIDIRVLVTDAAGIVIFDSDGDRDQGADYSQWRDVRLALAGEYGARSTHGDPLFPEGSTMYVSAPLRHLGRIVGTVSVGKPTRNAERFLEAAIERFTRAGIIALLVALLFAAILYRWVSRPLQRLYDYARELQTGKRVPPPALGGEEIARIGTAMTELRDALDGKDYVERYVQALAHELKSPAAAIRGAAELLGEPMPEADRTRFVTNIQNQAVRLEDLLHRMLALAAIENRPALDATAGFDLPQLLQEIGDSLNPLLTQQQVSLEWRLEPSGEVHGDRFLIGQAFSNLLKNAIEHAPAGSRIGVRTETAQRQALIHVEDQGPGIPEFARERIFERFFSVPRADGGKGSGLGLNFVQEIAELHGGSIELHNASSGGCHATLSWPQ